MYKKKERTNTFIRVALFRPRHLELQFTEDLCMDFRDGHPYRPEKLTRIVSGHPLEP